MVAAPAVRSVAPRLRDPCASVRPSSGVDVLCRPQFFAFRRLEARRVFWPRTRPGGPLRRANACFVWFCDFEPRTLLVIAFGEHWH